MTLRDLLIVLAASLFLLCWVGAAYFIGKAGRHRSAGKRMGWSPRDTFSYNSYFDSYDLIGRELLLKGYACVAAAVAVVIVALVINGLL